MVCSSRPEWYWTQFLIPVAIVGVIVVAKVAIRYGVKLAKWLKLMKNYFKTLKIWRYN